jgi:cytochrome c oxidase subunit 4
MSEQITSPKVYIAIFLDLMVLTTLTILAAFQNLGPLNDIVALGIAITKASLVVLYFMHVRHSTPFTKVVVLSGFVWFVFLIALTLADFFTRGWIHPQVG